jgi:hypothetical protein
MSAEKGFSGPYIEGYWMKSLAALSRKRKR